VGLELTCSRTYPAWSASHISDHSNTPSTPSYGTSAVGLENYLQVNQSNSDLPHPSSHSPTTTMSATHPPPVRQQYAYHPASAPAAGGQPLRFIDSNPRPAKSPRHAAPPELPSNVPYSDYGTRFAPPYSGLPEPMPPRNPDYFPNPVSLQTNWTTAPETGAVYETSTQTSSGQQHYDFPSEQQQYIKDENNTQSNYTWNSA
jgi:hypothetical protein